MQQLKQGVSTLRRIGGGLRHIAGVVPAAVYNNGFAVVRNRRIRMADAVLSGNLIAAALA